jgi:hypothetical protein
MDDEGGEMVYFNYSYNIKRSKTFIIFIKLENLTEVD